MLERDAATVLDLLRAADQSLEFVWGLDRETFDVDLKTQAAILHQLLVIGEAARRLSDEFREAHPTIPWKLIIGMRNRIIHEYERVNLDTVWQTLQSDVPQLIAYLKPLAPRPPQEAPGDGTSCDDPVSPDH